MSIGQHRTASDPSGDKGGGCVSLRSTDRSPLSRWSRDHRIELK